MNSKTFFQISIATLITTLPISSNATEISGSFSKAKQKLYKSIYNNNGKTFYVGCKWNHKKVDLNIFGLEDSFSKKQMKRAKRIEAEHVLY